MSFRVVAPYQPTGDQPRAIEQLVEGIQKGYKNQTLLGATATGKTFVMAGGVGLLLIGLLPPIVKMLFSAGRA